MKGARIAYSDAEMAWLEANRTMVISDYHRAFLAAFGRDDVSANNLHGLRKRKGWKVGRAPGRLKGRSWKFNAAERAWLKANCTLPIADYHAGYQAEFDRPEITAPKLHGLRKREGWRTGRTGWFAKGAASPNKGKRCPPGQGGRHPNARRTQFKPGARTGRAAEIYKPIGAEVVRDGYLVRKIHDGRPMQSRWRAVHLLRWEEANGPVPEGHCLKVLDGDRLNTDPSNWALIPRGVLPRLNGGKSSRGLVFDDAAPEVKPALLAIAKVDHAARRLRRSRNPQSGVANG